MRLPPSLIDRLPLEIDPEAIVTLALFRSSSAETLLLRMPSGPWVATRSGPSDPFAAVRVRTLELGDSGLRIVTANDERTLSLADWLDRELARDFLSAKPATQVNSAHSRAAPQAAPAPVPVAAVVPAAQPAPSAESGLTTVGHARRFAKASQHGAHYLLGFAVPVTSAGVLLDFGVLMVSGKANVVLALYTDSGGHPGALVAQTVATKLDAADQQAFLAPTTPGVALSPGTYWILGVYDASINVGQDTGSQVPIDYVSHPFGTPLPATFPKPTTYTAGPFNYFLRLRIP